MDLANFKKSPGNFWSQCPIANFKTWISQSPELSPNVRCQNSPVIVGRKKIILPLEMFPGNFGRSLPLEISPSNFWSQKIHFAIGSPNGKIIGEADQKKSPVFFGRKKIHFTIGEKKNHMVKIRESSSEL